jgi:hypothetical protein
MTVTWFEWIGLAGGLAALFVVWDLLFCGGRRCGRFSD